MRILLTGATGFIGRHVCARLLDDGHSVIAAVRDPASAQRRFPGISALRVDMNRAQSPANWSNHLAGVDAVVNCAGILQSGRGQSAVAIHGTSPIALFDACLRLGIRKVVQISAVSADPEAGTEYARTKRVADDHLRSLDLDWVVLRPSLVYGQGSFGGTSALRGLAGFPCFVPLIGKGDQVFQPIHVDDLAETVARSLDDPALRRRTLDAVGPETLSMRDILESTRRWLDLPPVRPLEVPVLFVRALARIGDIAGAGPITTTSIRQLEYGNVSNSSLFEVAIGFRPRTMAEAFRRSPSHVQDRWHARLYFLRPVLTVSLALLWLGSGVSGLLNPPADSRMIAEEMGASAAIAPWLVVAFCLLDIGIGAALAGGRGGRRLGLTQLVVVGGYTLGLTMLAPMLWMDPYGALLKNLPIIAAIGIWMALSDEK